MTLKEIAWEAASIIQSHTAENARQKDESDFVTQTDMAVHSLLRRKLPQLLPGSIVISEEDPLPSDSLGGDVWIIDPLDGTSNYVYGIQHSCVSIARLQNGIPIEGIIINPYLKEAFYAKRGKGAALNGKPIHVSKADQLKDAFIGFEAGPASKHTSERITRMMQSCYIHSNGIRMLGYSALDIAYVACGRFTAAYFDYLYPWDYAAGCLILEEAGGLFTTLTGQKPAFAGRDAFLASNGLIHEQIRSLI